MIRSILVLMIYIALCAHSSFSMQPYDAKKKVKEAKPPVTCCAQETFAQATRHAQVAQLAWENTLIGMIIANQAFQAQHVALNPNVYRRIMPLPESTERPTLTPLAVPKPRKYPYRITSSLDPDYKVPATFKTIRERLKQRLDQKKAN